MIRIDEIEIHQLNDYAKIPIHFTVNSILQPVLVDGGLGGIRFNEIPVEAYTKDYNENPEDWPYTFDIENWGLFVAYDGKVPVGGAAVAFNTDGVNMLEDRPDLAVLWDIRVHPEQRGRGVGKAIFEYAVGWSRQRGCTQLKIETQNVNVPACHFYQKMGCELGVIHCFGYAGIPPVAHEVMLNWYYPLTPPQ